MLPCRRFADVLADACARLGADVGRYSFIAVDFHHILLAGLPARSLALRPAHSRGHLYVTCYTEGSSHFVTSMTAPVASGWSGCRVGLAPTGKRRLVTAHTYYGRSGPRPWTPQLGGEPAYRGRAGNSRNRPETGHSALLGIASSPPEAALGQSLDQ
jgi:hypothetical protein